MQDATSSPAPSSNQTILPQIIAYNIMPHSINEWGIFSKRLDHGKVNRIAKSGATRNAKNINNN